MKIYLASETALYYAVNIWKTICASSGRKHRKDGVEKIKKKMIAVSGDTDAANATEKAEENVDEKAAEKTNTEDSAHAAEKKAYDAACKRLLADRRVLAWILKGSLQEYLDFDAGAIAEYCIEKEAQIGSVPVLPDRGPVKSGGDSGDPYSPEKETQDEQERSEDRPRSVYGITNEDTSATEGRIFYDIRFLSSVPKENHTARLMIDVEAQNKFYPGYPLLMRAIYYISRMISSQHGTEFEKSHYEKIRKVCSVWVCLNPPEYRENTITRYQMQEEHIYGKVTEYRQHYDLMTVVMICLGEAEKQGEIEDGVKETDILPGKTEAARNAQAALLRLLNVLFSVSLPPEEKSRILEEEFQIPKRKEMEEEMIMMGNLGQGIEDRALARGLERGRQEGVELGRREGMELGRREGVERGRAEGEAIGRLKALFDLVRDGKLTISAAAEAAAMDLSEFEQKYNESCQ